MEGKIQYNLKPGSIPTIFNHSTTSTTSSIERQNKEKERRQKLIENAFEDYSRRQKLEKEEDKEIKERKKIMEQYWEMEMESFGKYCTKTLRGTHTKST